MESQVPTKASKRARLVFVFFSILTGLSIIYCMIHPRGTYIYITLVFLLCWIISLCSMRSKNGCHFPILCYPLIIVGLIFIAYVLPIIFLFEYYFSARWPYEYKEEIKTYKEINNNIPYFPDELPENATQVKFIVVPSYMQAKGYITLSFVADDAYIQQYIDGHRKQFEQFNDIESWPEWDRESLYEGACVDLYTAFSEEYYDESYQEYCKAFSIDSSDAAEEIISRLLPQGVSLTVEEIETATQYHIDFYDGKRGFIIVKATNKIIFYRDYENM